MRRRAAVAALAAGITLPALAQGIAVPQGIAPQVIAIDPEPGGVAFSVDGGGGASVEGVGGAPPPLAAAPPVAGGAQAQRQQQFETAHLATLARQSYGATAIAYAQEIGVNPNATAAIASAESNFRNVPTANGSTSATGPWQITGGTWDDTVQRYDLPYTPADRTDPEAQAVVGNHVIRQYAAATQNALGRPATTAETYGSYVFGPSVGPRLATASPETALGSIVPAPSLRNNGMQSWTVGNFNAHAANRLGAAANQPALTPRS